MQILRNLLLSIPTTKTRILVSIAIYCWIAYAILVEGKHVSGEFMLLTCGMAGLDIAQYAVKRPHVTNDPVEPEPVEVSTDVAEMHQKG